MEVKVARRFDSCVQGLTVSMIECDRRIGCDSVSFGAVCNAKMMSVDGGSFSEVTIPKQLGAGNFFALL
jgi:hypothetical protein